ncbi:hypothetical protein JDW15_09955 [Aerococcaceae bacterium zg-ZJ1578]|uniref:hypothetical protein n=1 Tax=Aerococcaceae bacterium zg-252 TaxID=2796928 RepID=UPI001A1BCE10|nr:hypothetical protein [Aerococcaceae bacterium zg-1578]
MLNSEKRNRKEQIEKLINDLSHELNYLHGDLMVVPLFNFKTTDGEHQFLSFKDGKWFASRRNENLIQKFFMEEIPEEFKEQAVWAPIAFEFARDDEVEE